MALKSTYLNYIELANGDKYPVGGHHKTGSWSGLTYTATKVGTNTSDLAFTIPTGTTSTTVAVGNHTHDSRYVKLDDTIQNTNSFGGRRLYINSIDNAFADADKKYYVTITKHSKESGGVTYPYVDTTKSVEADDYVVDGPVVSTLTSSAHNLFDGSYETNLSCSAGQYLRVRIMFGSNTSPSASTSYFTGYPYGTYYISFYYNNTPEQQSVVRVYNKYAAHTKGWHIYNTSTFAGSLSGTNYIQYLTDSNDYQRSCVDFIIFGNETSGRNVGPTEIEYKLQRPDLSRDGSTVTKYGPQTLYETFTWYYNHSETLKIAADGTLTASKFKKYDSALAPASGQYLAVYDSNGFQRLTTTYTTFTDTSSGQKFLGSDFQWHTVKHQDLPTIPDVEIGTATGTGNAITSLTASGHTIIPHLDVNFATAGHTHTYEDVGAASAGHTHTYQDVGAASAAHTHTYLDVGAASAAHTHTYIDVGAASAGHNHDDRYTKTTDLGGAAFLATGTASGQIPVVTSTGKLPESVIPAAAITDTYVVDSQTAMLALSAQKGDVAVRTDINKSFILKDTPASTLSNWQELLTPADAVTSVNGNTGDVVLDYGDVGAASAGHNHAGVYQPLDADLTAIASMSGTGLLKRTGTDTWTLDTTEYTTNKGTVTSVRVQATAPVVSSTNTEQTTSLNTTISLAANYGDTQNPYGNKTARYALMAPTSTGAPSFRYITGADIIGGGINSLISSTTAVGINPAINGMGNMRSKGGSAEIFFDETFKCKLTNAATDYLFDGVNGTSVQFFSPASYMTPVYASGDVADNFVWSATITYAKGELVRSGTASGYRWYRSKVDNNLNHSLPPLPSGNDVGSDNEYWEYVSGASTYHTGLNPTKFTSVSIVFKLPSAVNYENGVTIYWRTASQHPNTVTVQKLNNDYSVYGTAVTDKSMTGETATTVYLGGVGAGATANWIRFIFKGFTSTNYWQCVPTQFAFTGNAGGIEGTVVMRYGGRSYSSMFGDFMPYNNKGANLGTSSYYWNNTYTDVLYAGTKIILKSLTLQRNGTTARTQTLQDKDGTIALLSDIPSVPSITVGTGTAVTSVTENQTASALTGITLGTTSVLTSVTLNNGSLDKTPKYIQVGTATAATGVSITGSDTFLKSIKITSTGSAASYNHTHSFTAKGGVTIASGTTGDVEVGTGISGTNYTPQGGITLATANFTTTAALTSINGGSGNLTWARSTDGSGRSARRKLAATHTHTAASEGNTTDAFTGIATNSSPSFSGSQATITPTLNKTKLSASFTGTASDTGVPSGTATGLVTGIGADATATAITGVSTSGSITYVSSVTSASGTSANVTNIKYLEEVTLNNPTLTPSATDVYNSIATTTTDTFLKNITVGTGTVVTDVTVS